MVAVAVVTISAVVVVAVVVATTAVFIMTDSHLAFTEIALQLT